MCDTFHYLCGLKRHPRHIILLHNFSPRPGSVLSHFCVAIWGVDKARGVIMRWLGGLNNMALIEGKLSWFRGSGRSRSASHHHSQESVRALRQRSLSALKHSSLFELFRRNIEVHHRPKWPCAGGVWGQHCFSSRPWWSLLFFVFCYYPLRGKSSILIILLVAQAGGAGTVCLGAPSLIRPTCCFSLCFSLRSKSFSLCPHSC